MRPGRKAKSPATSKSRHQASLEVDSTGVATLHYNKPPFLCIQETKSRAITPAEALDMIRAMQFMVWGNDTIRAALLKQWQEIAPDDERIPDDFDGFGPIPLHRKWVEIGRKLQQAGFLEIEWKDGVPVV